MTDIQIATTMTQQILIKLDDTQIQALREVARDVGQSDLAQALTNVAAPHNQIAAALFIEIAWTSWNDLELHTNGPDDE